MIIYELLKICLLCCSGGKCMEKPKEFNPPGKPIEPILPGKLMSASEQCKGRGWVDGNVCWVSLGQIFKLMY